MMNTIGNNPDAVQLFPVHGRPDAAHAPLTLRLREIVASLSSDEYDLTPDPGPGPGRMPDDDIASPE